MIQRIGRSACSPPRRQQFSPAHGSAARQDYNQQQRISLSVARRDSAAGVGKRTYLSPASQLGRGHSQTHQRQSAVERLFNGLGSRNGQIRLMEEVTGEASRGTGLRKGRLKRGGILRDIEEEIERMAKESELRYSRPSALVLLRR